MRYICVIKIWKWENMDLWKIIDFLYFYRANMAVENCKIRIFPLFSYLYPLHLRHINISKITIFTYFDSANMVDKNVKITHIFPYFIRHITHAPHYFYFSKYASSRKFFVRRVVVKNPIISKYGSSDEIFASTAVKY